MKTINDAAIECANIYLQGYRDSYPADEGDFIDVFEYGVEFAQQFYIIERNQYAEIDLNQKEELESNMPILVKYLNEYNETTYDVFAEYYPSLEDPIYTHWRPIELK